MVKIIKMKIIMKRGSTVMIGDKLQVDVHASCQIPGKRYREHNLENYEITRQNTIYVSCFLLSNGI